MTGEIRSKPGDLIITGDPKLEKYRRLVMRRDQLKKEILQLRNVYMMLFGELRMQEYELEIAVIQLKKEITWIIQRLNSRSVVDLDQLASDMKAVMEAYYEQLSSMKIDFEISRQSKPVSEEDLRDIRVLYRRIARKIHPDLHPDYEKDEVMLNLWYAAASAYECNDKTGLEDVLIEIESLNRDPESPNAHYLPDHLEDRIEKTEDEIERLQLNPILVWRDKTEDEAKIAREKHQFEQSIQQLEEYKAQLEKQKQDLIEGGTACLIH